MNNPMPAKIPAQNDGLMLPMTASLTRSTGNARKAQPERNTMPRAVH